VTQPLENKGRRYTLIDTSAGTPHSLISDLAEVLGVQVGNLLRVGGKTVARIWACVRQGIRTACKPLDDGQKHLRYDARRI